MDDRTDAFARLKRLHVQGVLSDAEYEQEKAALLAPSTDNIGGNQAVDSAGGHKLAKAIRRSTRWWLLGSFVAILIMGTWFLGRAYSLAEGRGELGNKGSWFAADSSPWTAQTTTDPMTDATVHNATATFEGSRYNIEIAVSCSSGGDISYSATSFDKEGDPAEMRSEIRTYGLNSWAHVPFQMRADGGAALSLATSNPQYNNQVVLKSGPVQPRLPNGLSGDPAEQMAAASKVALRLFMTSGEETIEWPQSDPTFGDAIRPCLEQRQAKREQLSITLQQEKAEQKKADQAYVDRLYEDVSVDVDTLVWLARNRNVAVDQARLDRKREREANLTSRPRNEAISNGM